MTTHPDRLGGLTSELVERLRTLVDGVDVDLDAPIDGEVEI
jgi:hypothetical protein